MEVEAGRKSGRFTRSTHRNAPPPAGVKEGKAAVVFGPGGAGKAYGLVTEAADAIKCVYNSLPKKVRAQRKGQHRTGPNMMSDIWDHWDEIDMAKAVKCLVLNEITDRAIGKASQAGLRDWRNNLGGRRPPRSPAFGMGPNRQALFNNYPKW